MKIVQDRQIRDGTSYFSSLHLVFNNYTKEVCHRLNHESAILLLLDSGNFDEAENVGDTMSVSQYFLRAAKRLRKFFESNKLQ